MKLLPLLRSKVSSVGLVMAAGIIARAAGLVTAVLLNRWGSDGGVATFYLVFNFGQTLAGFCNVGVSATALAALAKGDHPSVGLGTLPVRIFWHVQPRAVLSLMVAFVVLAMAGGFGPTNVETLLQGLLAAYGIAYNQVAVGCLLGKRNDREMAVVSLAFSVASYLPVVIVAAFGRAQHAGWALAAGSCLPLLIDGVRAALSRTRVSRVDLDHYVQGGLYIVLGNALYSIATLLVIQRVESKLAAGAIIAFGVVQQLRSAALFAPQQLGPLVIRAVAARWGVVTTNTDRIATIATLATAAFTALLLLPVTLEPRIIGLLFSGRVALDAAVIVGLWASCIIASSGMLCRVLEGRRAYRDVFLSNIVFAVIYFGFVRATPPHHFWIQTGLLAGVAAQFLFLVASYLRLGRSPAREGLRPPGLQVERAGCLTP